MTVHATLESIEGNMKVDELFGNDKFKIEQAINKSEKISMLGLEYITESNEYKQIPRTQMSARFDKGNTNTLTQDHAHIFAKPNGQGKQLLAINIDGTGHDGSSGKAIPKKVGDFLKTKGYVVPLNYVVESISIYEALEETFIVFMIVEG